MKVKVDKTVLASVALHVVVLGGVLLSFSTKAFVMVPEETVSVDVSFKSQSKSGSKTGKKENQNKIVEKVSEKPVDDAVGKISEKPPVVTETAPPPTPKVDWLPRRRRKQRLKRGPRRKLPHKPKPRRRPRLKRTQRLRRKQRRKRKRTQPPERKQRRKRRRTQRPGPKQRQRLKRLQGPERKRKRGRKRKQRRNRKTPWPVSRSCSTRKTRRVPRRPAPS